MAMTDPTSVDGRRLGGMSAATWRAAVHSPLLRSAMTDVFVLDEAPDPDALRVRMEGITRQFPALRSRIIDSPSQFGSPRLVPDPAFDLSLHLAHYLMPAPGSWQQVLQHVRRHSLTDLDRDRALWRATLIDGLHDARSAVILVVHHAICDGQGLVKIIAGLLDHDHTDTDPATGVQVPAGSSQSKSSFRSPGADHVRHGRAAQAHESMSKHARKVIASRSRAAGMLRLAGSTRQLGQIHSAPLSTLLTGRSATYAARTLDLVFPSLRAVAKQHGGSINDAFLTGLSGGIRHYHEASGSPAGKLRINVPVSFRRETDRVDDNTQAIARIVLDASEANDDIRFAAAQRAMAAARREPLLPHMDLVAEASKLLPIDAIVAMSRGSDLTASNVPGPPMSVRLGGSRVERIYPVVATMGAAANITLLSYAGRWCSIGVTVDEAAVEQPDLFVECLAQGFTDLGVDVPADPFDPLSISRG